jgi:hypothetical protein
MWRYLLLIVLLICVVGLVGCSGGGLNLGGSQGPGTVPINNPGTITPPSPSPGPGNPPGPPF